MKFYLGTHETSWLGKLDVPLFVSHRRLRARRTFPRARSGWALDSGGFTELSMYGEWRTTADEYVRAVRLYREEIGGLDWASPQDWMCEPWITGKTGLTVTDHQERTISNYLRLRDAAPDLPFVPVLQGWELGDYLRCVDRYAARGVDLEREPTVGVGSVCRRQGAESIAAILESLHQLGLQLHGFGVKVEGLKLSAPHLHSADSMAWSYRARRDASDRRKAGKPSSRYGCEHGDGGDGSCSNCPRFAVAWRDQLLDGLRAQQLSLGLEMAA